MILNFRHGEKIFGEQYPTAGIYFLKKGIVKLQITRNINRGRTTKSEFIYRLVSPGELFGYKSVVSDHKSITSAYAISDCEVEMLDKNEFVKCLNDAPPIVKKVLEQSVLELEEYIQHNQNSYLATVQERIAAQLVNLSQKFGINVADGILINLKLCRSELAQLASTINESLSRHLGELKSEKIIELQGKNILIKDLSALKIKSGMF